MQKLFIYPNAYEEQNYYVNNLSNLLKDAYEVSSMSKEKDKGLKRLLKGDVFHFNWYESIDSSSYIKTLSNYFKRKLLIYILKFKRKKIVWTMHNNQPHNSKYLKLDIKMMKFLAKKADRIHVLCEQTKENDILKGFENKIVLIPHGDYIDNYPKCNLDIRKKYGIDNDKKILLFVGQISRYKNIDLLIEGFNQSNLNNKNYVLLICGNCKDKEYKQELNNKKYENIIFDFNFVKNEEIEAYLRGVDLVIAPYNKDSSLNSGTLWMAMSYHKSMVLPLIGCVRDIKDYQDLLFVYDYDKKEEHLSKLTECLNTITESNLSEMGNKCYNYIAAYQKWEINKEKWVNLFKF